jgi:hypothetical protein
MTGYLNTASGFKALQADTTVFDNTATGIWALASNTTGYHNTANGVYALYANNSGYYNTASGVSALKLNTTGYGNSANGVYALYTNNSGYYNTASGIYALYLNTTGNQNTASGFRALYLNTTGSNNTANGTGALGSNSTGSLLTCIGYLCNIVDGFTNATAIGAYADVDESNALVLGSINGVNGATSSTNVGIGTTRPAYTLDVHGTGNFTGLVNFATGQNFTGGVFTGGVVNATTSYDIGGTPFAFGASKTYNAFLGFAGNSTMTGGNNTASGAKALYVNSTGCCNTATGASALFSNTTGYSNTATGQSALYHNITGNLNTASGASALSSNTTGGNNAANGVNALLSNTTGSANTASGFQALKFNTTGGFNTASGGGALTYNTSGSYNTALGYIAGPDSTQTGLTNATAIGAYADVAESNALVLGSINGVNGATSGTNVGIGTTTTQYTLDVNGNANFSGNVSIGKSVSKGSGSFKIDHPLDPANKYLYHSFVESPDMMNVYNGNVVTDKNGTATVALPDYFEALNRDFRYQLTVVGQFAQAIVAKKVDHNSFVIRTSKPNVEVSWQVTGIRPDAYANAHRIQVEEDKPQQEQGHYLHPELFSALPEQAVGYQAPPTPKHAETARVSTSTAPSSPLK